MHKIITENAEETKEAGRRLAGKIGTEAVICLSGELGAGKTTFTQGLLEGLGARGPFSSPTFAIMKQYSVKKDIPVEKLPVFRNRDRKIILNIYHFDAYRVKPSNILDLGWEELVTGRNRIIIVEWAEKIRRIIPDGSIQVSLRWKSETKREIMISKSSVSASPIAKKRLLC